MKKQNDTTTKGELLQDKWEVEEAIPGRYFYIVCNDILIATTCDTAKETRITFEQSKANAALICQAVNERQKLLDEINDCNIEKKRLIAVCNEQIKVREKAEKENKLLLDSNKELIGELERCKTNLERGEIRSDTIEKLQTAINNAKNIQP
jgi:hypothetical protein